MQSAGVNIAVVVGVAAVIAPIWTSLYLARHQSVSYEKSRVRSYARDVLRRSEETRDQFEVALREIQKANYPPCSPQEIDLMRKLDVGSSYIQAVGRVSGDKIVCNSLGILQPIPVGRADLINEDGVAERMNAHLSIAPTYPLTVISKNDIVILVDPRLIVDTPTEGANISIALFSPSSPGSGLLASRGESINATWLKTIPKGTESTSLIDGYVVSEVRAAHSDLAVIAAVPQNYASQRIAQFAAIFVPIGLLCGAGLVWAVIYISRSYLALPAVLKAAAKRREFFVEYQPIVELASRRWVGVEALVRWRSGGEIVRPDGFIPIAEESGVIVHITECVARIVAQDLPKFLAFDSTFRVAINLSAVDLNNSHTLNVLDKIVRISGANASNIGVEATERSFLQGPEALDIIDRIRAQGISVAIDDFGTGYSSLSCLESLGLDTLKIDKSFVETVDTDGATSQVVLHIIEMAHSLRLEMIAEGVETEAQAIFLEKRGVHFAQGWFFGKPMSISALCDALHKQVAQSQIALS